MISVEILVSINVFSENQGNRTLPSMETNLICWIHYISSESTIFKKLIKLASNENTSFILNQYMHVFAVNNTHLKKNRNIAFHRHIPLCYILGSLSPLKEPFSRKHNCIETLYHQSN